MHTTITAPLIKIGTWKQGNPNGGRAKPEEEHNPGQLSPEQALACQQKLQKAQKSSQEWSSKKFPLQGKWAPAASLEVYLLTVKQSDFEMILHRTF